MSLLKRLTDGVPVLLFGREKEPKTIVSLRSFLCFYFIEVLMSCNESERSLAVEPTTR